MNIKGYDFLDKDCPKRFCYKPGEYQHRGATGGGSSRNTGHTSKCCMERAYRGCPDPLPELRQSSDSYYGRAE